MKSDQVQTLNYCAHAIEDLRKAATRFASIGAPNSARALRHVIGMLQTSVKFILPNRCNLVDPDEIRQAHLDLMRLPYPCVAFEAPWESEDPGPAYVGDFQQTLATKRIALCWDSARFEPVPGLNSFFDAFDRGGAFVLPIYWGPEQREWTTGLGGVFVPYGNELLRRDIADVLPATRIAMEAKIAAGLAHERSMQFKAEPFPIVPELYEGRPQNSDKTVR